MGNLPAMAEILCIFACYSSHRRTTALYQPEMLRLRHDCSKVAQHSDTYLYWLRCGSGSRSECGTQHPFKSFKRYRGALGNQWACPAKRFWRPDLYCALQTETC